MHVLPGRNDDAIESQITEVIVPSCFKSAFDWLQVSVNVYDSPCMPTSVTSMVTPVNKQHDDNDPSITPSITIHSDTIRAFLMTFFPNDTSQLQNSPYDHVEVNKRMPFIVCSAVTWVSMVVIEFIHSLLIGGGSVVFIINDDIRCDVNPLHMMSDDKLSRAQVCVDE